MGGSSSKSLLPELHARFPRMAKLDAASSAELVALFEEETFLVGDAVYESGDDGMGIASLFIVKSGLFKESSADADEDEGGAAAALDSRERGTRLIEPLQYFGVSCLFAPAESIGSTVVAEANSVAWRFSPVTGTTKQDAKRTAHWIDWAKSAVGDQLKVNALAQLPFLASVERAKLEQIAQVAKVDVVEAGAMVCQEGLPCIEMSVIVRGLVHTRCRGNDGNQRRMNDLAPGGYVGAVELMASLTSRVTATAASTTIAVTVSKKALVNFASVEEGVAASLRDLVEQRIVQILKTCSFLHESGNTKGAGMEALAPLFRLRALDEGEGVCAQGSTAEDFYIVAQGMLSVTSTDAAAGVELFLATINPGARIGEMSLLLGERVERVCTASVRVVDVSAVMLVLPRENFSRLMDAAPWARAHLEREVKVRTIKSMAKKAPFVFADWTSDKLLRVGDAATRHAFEPLASLEAFDTDGRGGLLVVAQGGECSFIYRYILRESCSQFDSLPLTSLTISPHLWTISPPTAEVDVVLPPEVTERGAFARGAGGTGATKTGRGGSLTIPEGDDEGDDADSGDSSPRASSPRMGSGSTSASRPKKRASGSLASLMFQQGGGGGAAAPALPKRTSLAERPVPLRVGIYHYFALGAIAGTTLRAGASSGCVVLRITADDLQVRVRAVCRCCAAQRRTHARCGYNAHPPPPPPHHRTRALPFPLRSRRHRSAPARSSRTCTASCACACTDRAHH